MQICMQGKQKMGNVLPLHTKFIGNFDRRYLSFLELFHTVIIFLVVWGKTSVHTCFWIIRFPHSFYGRRKTNNIVINGHFEINWPLISYSFRQEAPPVLKTSNGAIDCEAKICKLCRERTALLSDECDNISTDGNTFYVTVVTHEPHQDGTVTFRGLTITKVESSHIRWIKK